MTNLKGPTMAEEEKPTSRGVDLSDYVHKAQAKSREDELLDAIDALTKENDAFKAADKGREKHGDPAKLAGRIAELEAKVRDRSHRDAFKALAKELKVKAEFEDDVYDLAKFEVSKDEADPKAMSKRLKEWLDERESRKSYLDTSDEEEAPEADVDESDPFGRPKAKGKLKLRTEESDEPATRGRGTAQPGATKFRYRSSDLADVEWMRVNGVAYSEAVMAGTAQRLG
jgi:hypothetical protein